MLAAELESPLVKRVFGDATVGEQVAANRVNLVRDITYEGALRAFQMGLGGNLILCSFNVSRCSVTPKGLPQRVSVASRQDSTSWKRVQKEVFFGTFDKPGFGHQASSLSQPLWRTPGTGASFQTPGQKCWPRKTKSCAGSASFSQ